MLDIKENSVQKSRGIVPFRGLTPSFHLIFHVICFFNTNDDAKNKIYCESLEITQKSVRDGVSFGKVTSLQCSDCNFTIKRTHHKYFQEYVPKTNCIKKNILRKVNDRLAS